VRDFIHMKKTLFLSLIFFALLIAVGVVVSMLGTAMGLEKNLEGFAVRELFWGLSALFLYNAFISLAKVNSNLRVTWSATGGRHFFFGVLIGATTFLTSFSLLLTFGSNAHFSFSFEAGLTSIGAALGIAMLEEAVFRGVLFHLVASVLPTGLTILIVAAVFALAHLDGRSSLALATTFLLGFAFTIAFVQFRGLWAPIGLHTGVGFFTIYASGIPGVHSGFVKFSGSQFTLEATFLFAASLLVAGLGVLWLVSWMRSGTSKPDVAE
jgi:membrane protease YdiL (CAAX protease family)